MAKAKLNKNEIPWLVSWMKTHPGLSYADIAEVLGVTRQRIHAIAQAHNVEEARQKRTDEMLKALGGRMETPFLGKNPKGGFAPTIKPLVLTLLKSEFLLSCVDIAKAARTSTQYVLYILNNAPGLRKERKKNKEKHINQVVPEVVESLQIEELSTNNA